MIDPPYRGTAGYQHKLERAEVVELAKGWAARGATVAVCEHEPIPEILADGWRAVQLSGQQVAFGPRTASVRVSEWVTLTRGDRR